MTFAGTFIVEDSLQADDQKLKYKIRLPWYRSLPLSSVTNLEVGLDGVPVDSKNLRVELNGKILSLEEFEPLWDEYWFVQDNATILIEGHPALGDAVEVRTRINLRSPYIMVAPDQPLITNTDVTTTFPVKGAN
ncbi:conserved hypothetical protein [Arthrobacter sp. 9AX]|uniref:C-glycoside deglycosidase beta subunit domain-containing protein n=1 Tax=Arthrobacter sp. 9AX TaxID=2653131 RepID=UPI0012F1CB6A|nr:DUF6379 domain-containing protein [Arthrobacter sp. 9AX]VXC24647.1 conserved hypothetical protein [Arthrobacter sp. 9AX]